MPGSISQSLADKLLKGAFLAGLTTVTYLSLKIGTGEHRPGISDKIKHAAAYAILGLIGMRAFRRHEAHLAGFLFVWGVLMEIGQSFVPMRSPEFADLLANLSGILLAWLVVRFASKRETATQPK